MIRSIKRLVSNRRPVGCVDHVSDGIVRGWAWNPARPKDRLCLDFFRHGVFLGQATTGGFRPDLLTNGFGDGRHGFLFHIPDDEPGGAGDDLQITVVTSGRRVAIKGSASNSTPSDVAGIYGPFLATLRSRTRSRPVIQAGDRTVMDTICAPAKHASAFVSHLARKYDHLSILETDRGALWSWYLGQYARERGPLRAPLSREDIQVLMRLRPDGRPAASGLPGGDRHRSGLETRYRWAIEESRRLFVEDCLVPDSDVAALRSVPGRGRQSFPLSTFMLMMRRRHRVLGSISIIGAASRRRLYALIMLLALRSPHYLIYLPSRWLAQMLKTDAETSGLEQTLAELFGAALSLSAGRYIEIVEESGFDLSSQTFGNGFYRGHRVLGGPAIVSGPSPVDVQIIGPLRRKMGLGESCRRIAKALEHTGFSLNKVDYDLRNSSATFETGDLFGRLRPARLNILHVNAEEIPEAYAYLSDVFSTSCTVAIPYWELNRPSAVHHLGLTAVDEVWVTSRYLETVFSANGRIVRWIGMSSDNRSFVAREDGLSLRTRFGISRESFTFLTTSDALSWVQRKNPSAVVAAFRAAFPDWEDVALVVKTHNLQGPLSSSQRIAWSQVKEACAADPRIVLIDQSFGTADQAALLAGSDALVSLHRAEGLGLDLIDAVRMGLPLIATAYSGNMDFCSEDTVWLVDYDLVPVDPSEYPFVEAGHLWAEPRLASAVAAMRGIYGDPDLRRAREQRGRTQANLSTSTEALAGRLEVEIERVLAGPVHPG